MPVTYLELPHGSKGRALTPTRETQSLPQEAMLEQNPEEKGVILSEHE